MMVELRNLRVEVLVRTESVLDPHKGSEDKVDKFT